MSKVINLNKARKARAKAEQKARADENVILHGRNKAEKTRDKVQSEKTARDLDAHRLDE